MGKKIEIVEIQACNKLHVSFSKRRAGLFKKAKELFTLCSADVAVIVFSAAGKLYVSDNPHSTEMVIHRYLAKFGDSPPAVDEHQLLDNNRSHVGTEEKKTQLGDSMKWVNVEAIGDFQNSFIDTDRGQNFRNAEKILHRKSVF